VHRGGGGGIEGKLRAHVVFTWFVGMSPLDVCTDERGTSRRWSQVCPGDAPLWVSRRCVCSMCRWKHGSTVLGNVGVGLSGGVRDPSTRWYCALFVCMLRFRCCLCSHGILELCTRAVGPLMLLCGPLPCALYGDSRQDYAYEPHPVQQGGPACCGHCQRHGLRERGC
jgi:hypothetical protein